MNDNSKLAVAALQNGTVIDHIPSHLVFKVVRLLDLENVEGSVTIGYNLDSKKLGKKGILKVSGVTFPEETLNQISGIDTLILNALRIEPHHSHLDLDSALQIVRRIAPRRTFFIHLSHNMGTHKEASRLLPENVFFAYDGLQIEI